MRATRIGANISLIKQNLIPLSFVDVPERAYVEGTLGVYELRKISLLRDVFVWAYERSCKRYRVIQSAVAEPDPLRLKHRDALKSIVAEIVRNKRRPTRALSCAFPSILTGLRSARRVHETNERPKRAQRP